jgi:hypothetical protein
MHTVVVFIGSELRILCPYIFYLPPSGGSNDHEFWGTAHQLGDQMDADTEESCTTYNVLKVARHLFTWTANASFGDFTDRALWNGIIGNQVGWTVSMGYQGRCTVDDALFGLLKGRLGASLPRDNDFALNLPFTEPGFTRL